MQFLFPARLSFPVPLRPANIDGTLLRQLTEYAVNAFRACVFVIDEYRNIGLGVGCHLGVIRSCAGLHGFFKTNWWQVLYLLFESLENKRGGSPIVINTLTSFKVWADEVPAT